MTTIKDNQGNWIMGKDNITQEAVKFYEHRFSKKDIIKDSAIMEYIPKLITEEDHFNLIAPPSIECLPP